MHQPTRKTLALSVGALGVVYGDIGTSPLYAFKECLHHGINSNQDIIGVLSLIIWTFFSLVTVKYLWNVMRADNQGEGGILALMSLAVGPNAEKKTRATGFLILLGVGGGALLYGDGVITPAITVLSAAEGMTVASDKLRPFVVPLTLCIVGGIFAFQHKGTATIGRLFGPVMFVWFSSLAAMGIANIAHNPAVFRALNPLEALYFFAHHGLGSIAVMGSVFLVVTGAEALYADMGHFGRAPIARAWTFLVCPALILNYLGQGALVLADVSARENPFFHMVPDSMLYPLIALSTAASVIASQALISGAFSLTMQGIQMGYIPRMEMVHTSQDERGQVYIPTINIMLAVGCVALVLGFRSSSALANTYGIAVIVTMLATNALFFVAAQRLWNWSPLKAALFCAPFAVIELAFLAGNTLKIIHGGWFPLAVGAGIFTLMTAWQKGRKLLRASLPPAIPLVDFIGSLSLAGTLAEENKLRRAPGTAIFLASNGQATPNAMLKNIKHNQMLHTRNIVLTIQTDRTHPHVAEDDRVAIEDLGEGFYRVTARFGFMEAPDICEVLSAAKVKGLVIQKERSTFFIGKERIVASPHRGMAMWREHLFIFMSKNAENAADFFRLPPDRVYEVSQVVEI